MSFFRQRVFREGRLADNLGGSTVNSHKRVRRYLSDAQTDDFRLASQSDVANALLQLAHDDNLLSASGFLTTAV